MSGTSQGEFDSLKVRNNAGQMVDILTLGGGGGGSGGTVSSAAAPLAIDGQGQLSLDLTADRAVQSD